MFGKGIMTGMGVTLKHFLQHFRGGAVTELYPDVMPQLAKRFHGDFYLDVPKCISCGLCANACPNHVISVKSEKDENNKRKLVGYTMMLERCLFCGFCVEACPTNAIAWTQNFELAAYSRDDVNRDMYAEYFSKNGGNPEQTGNKG